MTVQPKVRAAAIHKFSQKVPIFWKPLLFLTGLGIASASLGALLALSLNVRSLDRQPSPQISNATPPEIAASSLGIPRLNRPLNILILGIKVLSSELDSPPTTDPWRDCHRF